MRPPFSSFLTVAGLALLTSCGPSVPDPRAATRILNPDAPPETAQFGRLVGTWDIEDESPDSLGNWQPGPGAEWDWYYILNGQAIQDDWVAPPRSASLPDDTRRQFGTNIRIYNPADARWEMTWTSNLNPRFAIFTAQGTDSRIVMESVDAVPRSRITFFDMTDSTFEWKMEQLGGEEGWVEVYRIHGRRRR